MLGLDVSELVRSPSVGHVDRAIAVLPSAPAIGFESMAGKVEFARFERVAIIPDLARHPIGRGDTAAIIAVRNTSFTLSSERTSK